MSPPLVFPPFRLDRLNEQLWRGPRLLPIRPKTFAVLRYLVEHAGVLVTKDQLLEAIWPAAHGAEALPKKSVYELRKVLGDEVATPRFIETLARRGWRFIAPLTAPSPSASPEATFSSSHSTSRPHRSGIALVGREAELARLYSSLERTLAGERQIVFVTGEPGIGKTALVDAFLARLADDGALCIARGQCVEHHGAGEAYLPVLEAVTRLCQGAGGELFPRFLRRHAPTWLIQMPALIEDAELEALQRKVLGAAQERMSREMAEALEAMTAERPLVMSLEDLQWSDYSTVDLILSLALRRAAARLLLIGTYRPADVVASGHPLRAVKQELQAHGQCAELALPLLTVAEITKYLALRFEGVADAPARQVQDLARIIHQNTDGNPLFVVNMVDYLTARGVIGEIGGQWPVRSGLEEVAGGVPDNLRQLIEKQFERLSEDEQRVLEVASVVGSEFSTMAVATGLGEPEERADEWCERLARRGHFLAARDAEQLPDGTITGRYRFRHALYQTVLYERMAVARRTRLHREIGERVEVTYGEQAGDMAAELAMHFERGQDPRRAVQYLEKAARNALQRSANREAIDLVTRALDLLRPLPDTRERAQQELALQVTLAVPLMMTRGYTAPEVRAAYERARDLCRQIGQSPQIFPVVLGLSRFYYGRGSVERRNWSAEELLRLAESGRDRSLLLAAHMMQGGNLFFQGEFARAQDHAERGIALYDPLQHRALIFLYGDDPQVLCFCWAALALWYLGYPDRAMSRIDQALGIAGDLSHPFGLAFARFWRAFLHQSRGEGRRTEEHADALVAFADAHGIPQFTAMGTILRGWARAEGGRHEEGIVEIRHGMAGLRAIGQELGGPYFSALLAEALHHGRHMAEALEVVNEGLAVTDKTGECMHQAELYRLRGELLLNGKRGAEGEAEGSFQKAAEIARRQSAKSLELRVAISLGRLWRRQGKARHAATMLAGICRALTEGSDTRDPQEAKALLGELRDQVRSLPRRRQRHG